MKAKKPSEWLKPHIEDCTPEERHLIQKGFLLGLKYTMEEMDRYIRIKTIPVN